jgi:hypothetical protein
VAVRGKGNYVRRDVDSSVSFEIADSVFTLNDHVFSVGRAVDFESEQVKMADVLGSTPGPRAGQRDARRAAVRAALTDQPQSVREVAKAATEQLGEEIPKSSAQRLLDALYVAGEAEQTTAGWVAVPLSQSLREWDSGTPLEASASDPPTNAILGDDWEQGE